MATLARAIAIAATAHQHQVDKAGAPYILHPLAVMAAVATEAEKICAVLHDVVEDSDEWTFERLREEGFAAEVLVALEHVTKRAGESYDDFVARAARNPIARQVKLADLQDNLRLTRIREVTPRDLERIAKYHRAWTWLMNCGDAG